MEKIIILPNYAGEIVKQVSSRQWLLHSFELENPDDVYHPFNFLRNPHIKYTAFLDLNILRYLVLATKSVEVNELFRDAVAHLVLFHLAKIEVDPRYAIYERVNYDAGSTGVAISELEIFIDINNHHTRELADYALGLTDQVIVKKTSALNHKKLHRDLTKYKRLIDWDSFYLFISVITDINLNSSILRKNKFRSFVTWLIKDFRLSLPAIVYAAVLFSRKPIRGMMKFKLKQDAGERIKALQNMTWDLYYINRFFQYWIEKEDSEEQLLVSADRPFSTILDLAVSIQYSGTLSPLSSYIEGPIDLIEDMLLNPNSQAANRVYGSERWTPAYRSKLIKSFTTKLIRL